MPHPVKKGSLTTCLTTDSFGTHGNSGVKRDGEYAKTSRNYRKWPETYRKNLVQPFGSVRLGFEPQPSENPGSLGTLGLTAFFPSPITGQKSALTTCLTTIGKFHNRV